MGLYASVSWLCAVVFPDFFRTTTYVSALEAQSSGSVSSSTAASRSARPSTPKERSVYAHDAHRILVRLSLPYIGASCLPKDLQRIAPRLG